MKRSASAMSTNNFVYLIQEREFIKTGENIFKIGKTTQLPERRLNGYPKGSRVLLYIDVPDCHAMEKLLIAEFDQRYTSRRDIGREYYEGNENHMKNTFYRLCTTNDEPDPSIGWVRRTWRRIWGML